MSKTIWTNHGFRPEALELFKQGLAAAGHRLVHSPKSSASVLAAGASDPSMNRADVAFGQPDIGDTLRLTGVRLDERGAWELELGDGLQVRLGRQDVHERLERFIRLASPLVAKRVAEISYVDMRYTNGFSVGWNTRSALAAAAQEDATPDA